MLNRIKHQSRLLLHHPFKPSFLNPSKPTPVLTNHSPTTKNNPFFQKLGIDLNYLRNGYKDLDLGQIEKVIGLLGKNDPDSAVEVFELLKREDGAKDLRGCQFVVAHVLAKQGRFKLLRANFVHMLQDEGSGSAPSLCELLLVSFKGWEATAIVWDMLAFAYSRSEMVHDALFVIAKMKDLNFQPSILTYNSLLYNLRHTYIMWDVYNDIKESGIRESKQTTSILVDGLCKQSLMQEAVNFLHQDSSPHVSSFNTVMSSFSKMGFVDIAQSLFCLMMKFGVHPDAYSYNILINGLCVAGSIEDALKLTYDMDKHGVEPDTVTYKTLSKGFRVLGMINGAIKLIQQRLTKELKPDSITYTLLICGNCQAGKVEEGLSLRDEMISRGFELNYVSYSVLVSSLCKIGRVDEGLNLVYEMELVGLKPDDVMYSIIIHSLCKQGDVHRAIQVYMEMCTKKIFPTIFAHRAVLLGLCGTRPLSEARMYFDMLSNDDGNPDIVLYNIMINKYAKLGMTHETVQLYNQVTDKGIDPTIVTFNSLIYGFCTDKKLDKAMRLVDNIRDCGLVPTAVTYTTIMNFLCEAGNMKSMFALKREMEACGVEPTHVTYTVIIKGLCKQWKLQESLMVLDDMLSRGIYPDEVSYNILIQRFCKAREIPKAFELHDEMVSRDLTPDAVTYNILINGLCVYGNLHDADKLFLYLRENNFVLKKAAYTILIKAHCVKGDPEAAMVIFSEMVNVGYEATIRDYSAVVNRLCKRCLTNEAKVFFSMMFSNGVLPDLHLYTEIMYALREADSQGVSSPGFDKHGTRFKRLIIRTRVDTRSRKGHKTASSILWKELVYPHPGLQFSSMVVLPWNFLSNVASRRSSLAFSFYSCHGGVGVKFGSAEVTISHLFSVDDVIITTECNANDLDNIIRVLQVLLNMLQSKLSSWKDNLLSIWGRHTLIKAVHGSLARKLAWIKWKNVISSYDNGGLNIGSLKAFNLTLLQKWRWRLLSHKNALWVKVIKALHGQEGGFDNNGCIYNGTWARIVGSSNFLDSNNIIPNSSFRFQAGCGTRIRFWKDTWVGDSPFYIRYNRLYRLEREKYCLIIGRIDHGQWRWNWSRPNLGARNSADLLDILFEISSADINEVEDTCVWSLGTDETFSVKDARCIIDLKIPPSLTPTFWDKNIPRKVNIFIWRLILDRLPHKLNLSSRGINIHMITCPSCNGNMESSNHIFFECNIAMDI
ncbi:putative pentatricopeptide repeat-containing protein [Tanacetum coccineum]